MSPAVYNPEAAKMTLGAPQAERICKPLIEHFKSQIEYLEELQEALVSSPEHAADLFSWIERDNLPEFANQQDGLDTLIKNLAVKVAEANQKPEILQTLLNRIYRRGLLNGARLDQ